MLKTKWNNSKKKREKNFKALICSLSPVCLSVSLSLSIQMEMNQWKLIEKKRNSSTYDDGRIHDWFVVGGDGG